MFIKLHHARTGTPIMIGVRHIIRITESPAYVHGDSQAASSSFVALDSENFSVKETLADIMTMLDMAQITGRTQEKA